MGANNKRLTFFQKHDIIKYYELHKTSYVRLKEIFSARFCKDICERTVENIIDLKENIKKNVANGYGNLGKQSEEKKKTKNNNKQ